MKVSACWIVKNEEKNLRRSIESVRAAVDELIVVDTGSEDGTVKLAENLGAKVERFEWIGDFAAAKNYALSLCAGETVIFPDADEWFEPALTASDRDKIESIFIDDPGLEAIQLQIHNLNELNAVKTISMGNRIVRKKPGLEYQKRVHEQFLRDDGSLPSIIVLEEWKLYHSGYSENILEEKVRRNIALLRKAAEQSQDPLDRHLQHMYLVREYFQANQKEDCLHHLKIVLLEPEMINRQFTVYGHGIVPLIYSIIKAAFMLREHISRREIWRKFIEPFKKHLHDYPGAATIDLYYNALFALNEDTLLAGINPAIEASRKLLPSPLSYYLEPESVINQYAAVASFKRGNSVDAFEYALNSIKSSERYDAVSLRVILNCLRGQPDAEIVLFLNSQFGQGMLEYLTNGTRLDGFQSVHTYFLDKKINAGIATKGEFLYFLLLCGRYEDSVKASLDFYDENNAEFIKRNLFLAAVCSENEKFYRDNADILPEYSRILDSYFKKTVLQGVNKFELSALLDNFSAVALAAGLEKADRLAVVYQSQNLLCYQIKLKYLVENNLYSLALGHERLGVSDPVSEKLIIESLVMTGNTVSAIERIIAALAEGRTDSSLLSYLLAAIYRCEDTHMKSRAKLIYDAYKPLYDRVTDLNDVVKTGYASDVNDKKKRNSFKSLTAAQLNRRLQEDAAQPHINGLPELCEKAGAVYEEKGMLAAATECYIFALARNINISENKDRLVKLFRAFGNFKLASSIGQTK